jgi:hypothetical protein
MMVLGHSVALLCEMFSVTAVMASTLTRLQSSGLLPVGTAKYPRVHVCGACMMVLGDSVALLCEMFSITAVMASTLTRLQSSGLLPVGTAKYPRVRRSC